MKHLPAPDPSTVEDLRERLAANVLTPLADQIDSDQSEIALVADKLRSVFRRHRILARGGQAVELARTGENMAVRRQGF